MQGDIECALGQIGLQHHIAALRHKGLGDLGGHDDGQIGLAHDGGHGHEVGRRQPHLMLQLQLAQDAQRLGMRAHDHIVEAAQMFGIQPLGLQTPEHRMPLAQQQRVAIGQQHLLLRARHTGQKTDGNVQRTAIERIGNLGHGHGQGFELHIRSLLTQGLHQRWQETRLANIAEVNAKALIGLQGVKAVRLRQGNLQRCQSRAHGNCQTLGPGRGPHSAMHALEQRVAQQLAQPRHCLAGSGLGQAQLMRRTADAAMAKNRIENTQQIEIQPRYIHDTNIS